MQQFMKKLFKDLRKDTVTLWGFIISILCILLSIISIGIFYTSLPPFLPVYNKLPWGYARLGTRLEFFIPVGLTILFAAINIIVSGIIYKKEVLLARIACFTTVVLCIFLLIYTVKIIFLVK